MLTFSANLLGLILSLVWVWGIVVGFLISKRSSGLRS